jgi:hypothetical protein
MSLRETRCLALGLVKMTQVAADSAVSIFIEADICLNMDESNLYIVRLTRMALT